MCVLFICFNPAMAQMEVKDINTNVLISFNDEGSVGSITLPSALTAPLDVLYKLYTVNDSLFFNGNPLGLWKQMGNNIYYNSGNVGIGTTTPGEKLEVSGNIKATGTIQSGSSIVIDDITDKITAAGGTINFENENLTTTGTTTTNELTISGLDCSANANGGALTANASGVVSCSDDDRNATKDMAKMTRAAVQSIPHDTKTKIAFDTENFDIGGIADASGTIDSFDIKKSGVYLITATWTSGPWLDNTKFAFVYIYVNGTIVKRTRGISPATDSRLTVSITDVYELSVGDYVEMFVYHDQGTTEDTGINNDRAVMSVVQL